MFCSPSNLTSSTGQYSVETSTPAMTRSVTRLFRLLVRRQLRVPVALEAVDVGLHLVGVHARRRIVLLLLQVVALEVHDVEVLRRFDALLLRQLRLLQLEAGVGGGEVLVGGIALRLDPLALLVEPIDLDVGGLDAELRDGDVVRRL